MPLNAIFAQLVSAIGAGAAFVRHRDQGSLVQATGHAPVIPRAHRQGAVPTLKMPTARGWKPGEAPIPDKGLAVNAFARDLVHPRQMLVLPNGDVLVAEASSDEGRIASLFDFAMVSTMKRAGAIRPSANRITLLRDADGDGVAEVRETFLAGLNQPFGMALIGNTFYVGNTDSVMAFPYEDGATRITGPGKTLMTMKPGGHWTRNLCPSADGRTLFVSVGSLSNIAESGFEVEEGRACIYALDLETGTHRIYAGGLRNPVGMAIEPETGHLFTVVNERDGLGDETPPDYLTSVKDGGFYGWPYSYWGQIIDDRVPQDAAHVARATAPDFALGGHTASLGLAWIPDGVLPGFGAGMAIGQHGSWNRSTLSGYKLAFVPFADGKPKGPLRDVLTGFLSADEKYSSGRPVGVALAKDNSVLLADDVGDVIWRVTAA